MKLYSTTTGAPVDVPDDQVPAALQSQQYGLPAGASIPVQHEDGSIKAVPIEQAHQVDWGKSSVVPKSALESAQLQEKYGGAGQQALTAVEQGLGGATLGLSTAAEGAFLGNKEDILAREKANPLTAAGATVAGALLPTLLAPETGAGEVEEAGALGKIASALGAPSRALSGVAEGAGGAVRAALGATGEESLVASLAKAAASRGVAGAVEGAGIGLAQHLTEAELGDPDANGESLLAAAGHGALLGLGAGAGLSVAGELGSRALGRIAPRLSGLAEDAAVRAVAPKAAEALEELPGGARAAGRRLLDDGIVKAGDTAQDIADRLPKAIDEAEVRAAKSLEVADGMGHPGPSVRNIVDQGQKEIEALKGAFGGEEAGKALRKQLDEIERLGTGLTWEEAAAKGLNYKAMVDSVAFKFADGAAILGKVEGPLKGIIQREFDAAGERAAKAIGGPVLEEFRDAKLAASQFRTLLEHPPTEPSAVPWGHAVLAAPFTGGKSLALAAGKALAQRYGLPAGAVALDKLATLHGIERSAKRLDREIARGLSGAVPSGSKLAPIRVKSLAETYEERAAAVRAAARDPSTAAATAASPLDEHAPQTSRAFQGAAVRATQYLASLLPPLRRPPSITPQFDRPPAATPKQRSAFMRASDVAHDPAVVLQRVQEGRLTSDHVKALAAIYPTLYARVVDQASQRLADVRHPLSTVQRQSIETLLDRKPDTALAQRFQQTYASMAAEQPNMQQQDQQHKNRNKPGSWVPKRPITSPAKDSALQGGGRPVGS